MDYINNLIRTKREVKIGKLTQKCAEIAIDNEVEREKWIHEKIKSMKEGASILDAGAGERPYMKFCGNLHYVSQDFCQYDGVGNEIGGLVS